MMSSSGSYEDVYEVRCNELAWIPLFDFLSNNITKFRINFNQLKFSSMYAPKFFTQLKHKLILNIWLQRSKTRVLVVLPKHVVYTKINPQFLKRECIVSKKLVTDEKKPVWKIACAHPCRHRTWGFRLHSRYLQKRHHSFLNFLIYTHRFYIT